MTLSIEVLPAPLGPIMARISPLRISKETSTSARTPPNAKDTRSTESSTSPAATSRAEGALMFRVPLERRREPIWLRAGGKRPPPPLAGDRWGGGMHLGDAQRLPPPAAASRRRPPRRA